MGVQAVAYAFSIATTEVIGWYAVAAFAVNMVASAIISKAFFNPPSFDASGQSPNPGNRQQVPPATDNKLPVIYGSAWLGGTITDLSITSDNQDMYFVLSLCEVTNTPSSAPDTITFGNIYYGGKKVIFDNTYQYKVTGLLDESTGALDTTVDGKIEIYLYSNGSNSPYNSSTSAISVMQASGLSYQWDSNKLMSNCAFAIVHLTYNQDANVTGLAQTKFNVINARYQVGDCIYDYLTNTRYGCSIPSSQVDTTSLNVLNTYCNQSFTYTTYTGSTSTQTRFRFDGAIDTTRTCMANLQDMASCCDALLTYNEITAKWGVITQKPTYTVAMDLNDSNIISSLQVTPIDLAGSYNVIECKFPDKSNQDAFNSVTFDLATIAPSLLYPNEPVNKMSIALPLVNDSVRAQYIANRLLKSAREDLQLQAQINYVGIQLQAGDVVTVTNSNYQWVAKLFRINKVVETYTDDGSITAKLTLSEFNPTVYNDVSITQFKPAPNSGIPNPLAFGTIPAPVVTSSQPSASIPSISIQITTSTLGIVQYAELYYSAYSSPTNEQLIFAGTTAINPNGNPYEPSTSMPIITLTGIPAGTWYFFSKMVNNLGKSNLSPASISLNWRPLTFQYSSRYISVAYGTSSSGAGFSFNPSGKTYFGLYNNSSTSPSSNPSDYTWYAGTFSTTNYLLYCNRGNNLMSFAVGGANYAGGSAQFVPSDTGNYDPSIWNGLPNGLNVIDLNMRTGQLIQLGDTTYNANSGMVSVNNNPDGKVVASLAQLLNFGTGVITKTASAALITVDIYGRIRGFEAPDNFYYTMTAYTSSAGQTVFSVTRSAGYVTGNSLVFENGCLLDTSEYTDNTSNITFPTGRSAGDIITIISMKSTSTLSLATTGASGTGSVATITFGARDTAPFAIGDSITVAGVTPSGYNGTYTVTACDTTSVSFASTTTGSQTVAGTIAYTNNVYKSFTRNTVSLSNQSNYTASGFTLVDGNEFLLLNGLVVPQEDYSISGQTISFVNNATGDLQVIQWHNSNLGQPNGNPTAIDIYTIVGQDTYMYSYDPLAFNLYQNGVMLLETVDYSAGVGSYTLASTPTTIDNILVQQTFSRTGAV